MPTPKLDILVNLLTALQPFANGATSVALNDADQDLDYSRLIGGLVVDHDDKINQLTSSLNNLYGYVTTLQNQMATILANGLTVPQIQLSVIMGDNAYYPVEAVILAIGSQLNSLTNATGGSTPLAQAVTYQDKIYTPSLLKDQLSFTTGNALSTFSGWVASPVTAADSIKNMWITINDMRKAYQTRFTTPIITTCPSPSNAWVNFNVHRDIPNNRITLYFLGNCSIPDGFIDVDSNGATLRIEDGSSTPNVYNTYINVLQASKNVNGITIDLNNTNINIYTTLTLLLTFSLTNGSITCSSSRTVSSTTSTTPCVSITLTPLSTTSFTGIFTPSVFGANRIITYTVSTYTNEACTTLVAGSTLTYVNPTQSQLTYTLSGLTTATTYYVRMTTAVGGLTAVNCLVQSIKTL